MPYTQVTLAQLQGLLTQRWGNVAFWSVEEGRLALNEGLLLFSLYTGFWKRRVTLPTITNQVYYPLPSTLTQSARVFHLGRPLVYTSIDDQDAGRPGWEGERTNSGGSVPRQVLTWIPCGLSSVALWPADAVSGNSLMIDGLRKTPTLTTPLDFVDLGREDQSALVGYALHALLFKGYRDRWKASKLLYQQFLQACIAHNPLLVEVEEIRQALGMDDPKAPRRKPPAHNGAVV